MKIEPRDFHTSHMEGSPMKLRIVIVFLMLFVMIAACSKKELPAEQKEVAVEKNQAADKQSSAKMGTPEKKALAKKKTSPEKKAPPAKKTASEEKAAPSAKTPPGKNTLFIIKRSTNKNEVVYEARQTPDGLNTADPIKVYWIMYEKGGKIENLNALEKRSAYGVSIVSATKDKVEFNLKALKTKKIEAVYDKKTKTSKAIMTINGEPCYLESVYINVESRGLNPIPKVLYVNVTGRSVKSGKEVTEQIKP